MGYSIIFLWKKNVYTINANFENIDTDINKILYKDNIIEDNKWEN